MRIAVGTFSAIMTATLGALLVAATVAAQTPGGTTRYAIMRNGEQVGTHAIEVSCTGPETNIRISTDLIVKVLFVTAYRPCDDPLAHRRNGEPICLIWFHFFCTLKSLGRLVCTPFYAMTRRFSPLFDASVHTERTRRGDLHPAQIGILARPSSTEGKICQQHLSSTEGCGAVGARNRAAH